MNTEQLKALKELLGKLGYEFISAEQNIVNFDNKKDKGEFIVTYKARFTYEIKIEKL